MACLQLLSARLARVDTLVYHSVDKVNSDAYIDAALLLDRLVPTRISSFLYAISSKSTHG
jgi:hypothetical protein